MEQVPQNKFRLAMQLHITGRCNLRCKHCYITDRSDDALSLSDIRELVDAFCDLVQQYNRDKHICWPGQINLTGGEPFIREDIWQILEYIAGKAPLLKFAVLTNGSMITPNMAQRLKALGPIFVQVSIDGNRRTHDRLRAPGNFNKTLTACDILHRAGIRTLVSFTANSENIRDYPAVLWACHRHKVDKLWTDRLVPIGSGQDLAQLSLGPQQYRKYVQSIRRLQKIYRFSSTEVALTRSLQFMSESGQCLGPHYTCSAGDSLITVDENGTVYPCRRLPMPAGNVKQNTLSDIYYHSPVLQQFRNRTVPEGCQRCQNKTKCYGGSRCIAYAVTGDSNTKDPGCWL